MANRFVHQVGTALSRFLNNTVCFSKGLEESFLGIAVIPDFVPVGVIEAGKEPHL
jgi:hypothetical protein